MVYNIDYKRGDIMSMRSDVEAIVNSKISSYQVSRDTGIPPTNIKRLRLGETSIDNIRFHYAEKLSAYYKKLKRKGEID